MWHSEYMEKTVQVVKITIQIEIPDGASVNMTPAPTPEIREVPPPAPAPAPAPAAVANVGTVKKAEILNISKEKTRRPQRIRKAKAQEFIKVIRDTKNLDLFDDAVFSAAWNKFAATDDANLIDALRTPTTIMDVYALDWPRFTRYVRNMDEVAESRPAPRIETTEEAIEAAQPNGSTIDDWD